MNKKIISYKRFLRPSLLAILLVYGWIESGRFDDVSLKSFIEHPGLLFFPVVLIGLIVSFFIYDLKFTDEQKESLKKNIFVKIFIYTSPVILLVSIWIIFYIYLIKE